MAWDCQDCDLEGVSKYLARHHIDETGHAMEYFNDTNDLTGLENTPDGRNVGRAWERQAVKNVEKWGIQHPEELLSAIVEEVGEIEQAYLEATHEGGDPLDVQGEIDDLGPLLMQLVQSVRTHPMAFDPLPTVEDMEVEFENVIDNTSKE